MRDENMERAMEALLDDSNKSLTAAAKAAGLSRRQVYNYFNDRRFVTLYRQKRELQAIERADQLAALREKAITTLTTMMNDTRQAGAVRVQAARQLLQAVAEAEQRLDDLQRTMDNNSHW